MYRGPYRITTKCDPRAPVAGNVLDRRFAGWALSRAWVADITYVATAEGWLYLAAVIDLCSRKIVGWAMADHLRAELVCDAIGEIILRALIKQLLIDGFFHAEEPPRILSLRRYDSTRASRVHPSRAENAS